MSRTATKLTPEERAFVVRCSAGGMTSFKAEEAFTKKFGYHRARGVLVNVARSEERPFSGGRFSKASRAIENPLLEPIRKTEFRVVARRVTRTCETRVLTFCHDLAEVRAAIAEHAGSEAEVQVFKIGPVTAAAQKTLWSPTAI